MLKATLITLVTAVKNAHSRQAAISVIKRAEKIGRSSGYRSGVRKAGEMMKRVAGH